MSMGNNRDYKTTHDRAFRNLKIHGLMFAALLQDGMSREEADDAAYNSLRARDLTYRAACKSLGLPAKRVRKVAA